ncbi:MAG: dTDP-glucose 4,6-dehydratase [Bdellovibrionota bacterium]
MGSFSRILVTGAAGFIGSHFVERLLLESDVERVVGYDLLTYAGRKENLSSAMAERRFHLVTGDIRDTENLRLILSAEGIDAIAHFAAETHVDRSILGARVFVETNVNGTYSILEAAKSAKISRLLHVSTDEVYGSIPGGEYAREDRAFSPSSPYAATKAAADLLVQSFAKTHGLPAVIVRGSNNYGPRQFPEKLIPFMLSRIQAGESLPLYGDGSQRRDWIWVADFCAGALLALQKGKAGEAYNLAGGNEWSNREVVETLCREMGYSTGRIESVADRPAHDRRYAMDSSKARKELGFSPRRDFVEGIVQTVSWYKKNQEWVRTVQKETAEYFQKNYGGR